MPLPTIAKRACTIVGRLSSISVRNPPSSDTALRFYKRILRKVLYIIGNYQPQIDQAIFDAGQQEIDNGKEDLFFCDGGDNGIINWTTRCSGGCVDAGPGNSDHC